MKLAAKLLILTLSLTIPTFYRAFADGNPDPCTECQLKHGPESPLCKAVCTECRIK